MKQILGNNNEGIRLLQRFLDTSGDIQSTTLIAIRAFPSELLSDIVKEWIKKYFILKSFFFLIY